MIYLGCTLGNGSRLARGPDHQGKRLRPAGRSGCGGCRLAAGEFYIRIPRAGCLQFTRPISRLRGGRRRAPLVDPGDQEGVEVVADVL